jgi:uncharacterized protein
MNDAAPPPSPDSPTGSPPLFQSVPPPLPPSPPAKTLGIGIGKAALLCLIWIGVCTPISVAFEIAKTFAGFEYDAMAALLLQQSVAWPVTLWIALRWGGTNAAETFLLKPFSWRLIIPIIVVSLGLQVLLSAVSSLIPMPAVIRELIFKSIFGAHPLALFAAIAVAAPLAEELFFRGAVFGGFRKRYTLTKSIWLSALLFAAFHLNPWQAVVALPLGVLFAWMVVKTGSILPSMLSHFVVNLSGSFLLIPAAAMFYSTESIRDSEFLPLPIIGVGAALTAIGGGILWRQLKALPTLPACTRHLTTDHPSP